MDGKPKNTKPGTTDTDLTNLLVKWMNFILLVSKPRKFTNFRWADTIRDGISFVGNFAPGQFTRVYGRITARYNYHPLQQWESKVRKFDITDSLRHRMEQSGNIAFYEAVCPHIQSNPNKPQSSPVDFTTLAEIASPSTSANYLYTDIYARSGEEAAKAARRTYLTGYSRVIDAYNYQDWENFRTELRNGQHLAPGLEDDPQQRVSAIALSYKGKSIEITRRMRQLNDDGTPVDDEWILAHDEITVTSDFVDDFRWSQVVRSCMAIARQEGTNKVRIWIDRLMGMGLTKDQAADRYRLLDWEEYGLFAYAVCPVLRVHDANEKIFKTDFWRKLETVLGVAGRGLVVDDYMLRKYDENIHFGPTMYHRIGDGLSSIGGGGIYVRSVTLALATAVLTDGASVRAANEDLRTRLAARGWKTWAIRTIAEGAYSANEGSMMRPGLRKGGMKFVVGYQQFLTIALWESMVSRCPELSGNSYLDLSIQRSMEWSKSSTWNGITEWIGMMADTCTVEDKDAIMSYLTIHTKVKTLTSTTGHVSSLLTLSCNDGRDKRCLAVDLTRFSTPEQGHVTAVAEATGLWGESILPPWMHFRRDPDKDQSAEITDDGIVFKYDAMAAEYFFAPWLRIIGTVLLALLPIFFFVLARVSVIFVLVGITIWGSMALYFLLKRPWPWTDLTDVGEAVFDNLLLHGLYGSGIKLQYRKLQEKPYRELGWS